MKRTLALLVMLVVAFAMLSNFASSSRTARAQTGSGPSTPLSTSYDLSWNVVAGGGETSTGSGYTLTGTIGQSDADVLMIGGDYSLAGGFWGSGANRYKVYLPVVLK